MSPNKGLFPLCCYGDNCQLQFGLAFSSMFLCGGDETLICLITAGIEGQLPLMGLFGVQRSNEKYLADSIIIKGELIFTGVFRVCRSNIKVFGRHY